LLLADDGLENISGLGDVREINLSLDLIRLSAGTGRPGGRLCLAGSTEVSTQLLRLVVFHRTGMGFLFRDPNLWEHVKNGFALDFQFSGQIVDSNLAHPPFVPPYRRR
jgi:hypothetical protein